LADPFIQTLRPAIIAAGQALSPEVDLGGYGVLVAIMVPANWTTAGISFQCSVDGGTTWGEVLDATSGNITIASLTGGTLVYYLALDPARFRGVRSIKVRSGTQAAPVVQANQVTLQLVLRQVF
jgi:hypothetical protein